ncbi:MAG: RluA family pseudouridine synthase [Rectinemataceae bacterium]
MAKDRKAAAKAAKAAQRGSDEPSAGGIAHRTEVIVAAIDLPRADRFIAETLALLTRSQLKARKASIEVNGKQAKLSRPLALGDRLVVAWTEEPSAGLVPEDLPLDVLFEDDQVLVVNKARGMVTHPGAGNHRGTLANAALGRCVASLPEGSEPQRGGVVHRLDKDTSGVIIVAKDSATQAFLAAQFKDRTTRKDYLAITSGCPASDTGRIEDRLGRDRRDRKRFARVAEGGRVAVTDWRVVSRFDGFALVHLRPRTGRTHQLRVHLAGLGTPVVGDPIYGRKDDSLGEMGLMLHAWKLAICLPGATGAAHFRAPLPPHFARLLRALKERRDRKKPRAPSPGGGATGSDGRPPDRDGGCLPA